VCTLEGAVELRTAGGTSAGFAHDGACLCLLWESHFLRATGGTDDEQAECLGRWRERERLVRGIRTPPEESPEEWADLVSEFESAMRIVDADDKLATAWLECGDLVRKLSDIGGLYAAQRNELAVAVGEAKYWKKRATMGAKK
jgi:hypothetical protein